MSNELTVKQQGVIAVMNEKGLDTMIRPLVREIHLFDTYVAGTSYLKDTSPLETLAVNDALILKREDNRFDEKAILVLDSQSRKLGYVPERDNTVFSRLMDAGKMLKAKVTAVENSGYFVKIAIAIYLVDY